MSRTIVPEVCFFFSSVSFGVLLCACYDQLRVLRTVFLHPVFLVDAEDILFFLTAGLGFFGLIYVRNEGIMRWFAFFGCALGAVCYLKTVGPFLRLAEVTVLNILLFPARKILGILKKWLQKKKEKIKIKKQKNKEKQGSSGEKAHEPKREKAKKKKRT